MFARQMDLLRRRCAVVTIDDVAALAEGRGDGRDAVAVTFDDGYEDVYDHAFPILKERDLPATLYVSTAYVEERRSFTFGGGGRDGGGPPLSWPQIEEMAASGLVTVGAHTHTHPDLTTLEAGAIGREMETSNDLIRRRLGAPPRHFAYPWNRVSPAARAAAARLYRTAAAGGGRKNIHGQMDPHALSRYSIQQADGLPLFRERIGG
jgi:peptidoglycan/xylan/chitin deacetylase (PgdA/CDA1 family)